MKQLQTADSSQPKAQFVRNLPPLFLLLSRVALSLTALLLLLMPWTERFATWDRFLRGGDDLELGLLATIALLSLVLLLAEHRRGTLTQIAALTHWPSFLLAFPAALAHAGRGLSAAAPVHLTGRAQSACPPPLRI